MLQALAEEYLFDPTQAVSGNDLRLLIDGPEIFAAVLRNIENAKYRVALQIYEFASDEIGFKVRDALLKACQRGLEVKLMYDAFGSIFTSQAFFTPLEEAGAQIKTYHSISPFKPTWRWAKRNHRKMLLCDSNTSIIGGFNIANAYHQSARDGGYFDIALEMSGPACTQAWDLFHQTFGSKKKSLLRKERRSKHRKQKDGKDAVYVVGNDHFWDRWRIRREILHTLSKAKQSIVLTNPYFLPDPAIINALINAKKRGVKVDIMVPAFTDVTVLDLASQVVQHRLLKEGIRVHKWPGFCHGKAIVIDELWLSVGSFNMDYRSLFHNLEVVVEAIDSKSARQLHQRLQAEIRKSTQANVQDWKQKRLLTKLVIRFLYRFRAWL